MFCVGPVGVPLQLLFVRAFAATFFLLARRRVRLPATFALFLLVGPPRHDGTQVLLGFVTAQDGLLELAPVVGSFPIR